MARSLRQVAGNDGTTTLAVGSAKVGNLSRHAVQTIHVLTWPFPRQSPNVMHTVPRTESNARSACCVSEAYRVSSAEH